MTESAVIACIILAGIVVFVSSRLTRAAGIECEKASALLRECSQSLQLWEEAYEARDAQLAEARTRIDTLEGELTAADIALSQARKNDHRDAKGRFARAA